MFLFELTVLTASDHRQVGRALRWEDAGATHIVDARAEALRQRTEPELGRALQPNQCWIDSQPTFINIVQITSS